MISGDEASGILSQLFKGVLSMLLLGWVLFFVTLALGLAAFGAWVFG
jgi:hypothetical protein